MENEVWKDIPGYEGLYKVSDKGNVVSRNYNHTGIEKKLSPGNTRLYWNVTLSKNKKTRIFSVHRLVASAFLLLDIENTQILVCHKDDNGHNNDTRNLFLGTVSDNAQDCLKKGRKNSYKKKIEQYTISGEFITAWGSVTEAGNKLGIKYSNIVHCCKGKRKSAGGFIWKYYFK